MDAAAELRRNPVSRHQTVFVLLILLLYRQYSYYLDYPSTVLEYISSTCTISRYLFINNCLVSSFVSYFFGDFSFPEYKVYIVRL